MIGETFSICKNGFNAWRTKHGEFSMPWFNVIFIAVLSINLFHYWHWHWLKLTMIAFYLEILVLLLPLSSTV